jgi:LemA protein
MRRARRNIILLFIALLAVVISKYYTMAGMEKSYMKQWANVENRYQNKIDILPKMLATIKANSAQEDLAIEQVKSTRLAAAKINVDAAKLSAGEIERFQQAQAGLSSAVLSFYDLIEQDPELQSNQDFLDLKAELAGIENRTLVERRRFNQQVKLYNDYLAKFPNYLIGGLLQFKKQAIIEFY